MADLTDSVPSNRKIQELQKELDNLKNYVSGPKFLYDQTSKVYSQDAGAYYDPTLPDKEKRMKYLQERIEILNEQMKLNFKPIVLESKPVSIKVQNFTNKNREETNGFIGRSYYYQVGNSTPAVKEKDETYKPKIAERQQLISEVPKGKLVEQNVSTATNDDISSKDKNEKLVGYKTVATNIPKAKINTNNPSSIAKLEKRTVNVVPSKSKKQDEYVVVNSLSESVQKPKEVPISELNQTQPNEPQIINQPVRNDNNKVPTDFTPKAAPRDPVIQEAKIPMTQSIMADRKSNIRDIKVEKKAEVKKVEIKDEKVKKVTKREEITNIEPILANSDSKIVATRKAKNEAEVKVEPMFAESYANLSTRKEEVEKKPVKKPEEKEVPKKLNTQGFRYETIKIVQN